MCAIGTLHRFTERLLSWIKNIRIKIWIQRSLHHIILFAWIAVILHNALINAPYDDI